MNNDGKLDEDVLVCELGLLQADYLLAKATSKPSHILTSQL